MNTLEPEPEIAAALTAAGFTPARQPGSWRGCGDIAVDLMVVPHQSGRSNPSARAASIPPHTRKVARITPGLEPALLDHAMLDITALEPTDLRTHTIAVAGPSALITAKLLKISERVAAAAAGQRNRVRGKDALDVFRILRSIDTQVLLGGFTSHKGEDHARLASSTALDFLRHEGTHPINLLPRLAAGEAAGDPTIAPSFAALTLELLDAVSTRHEPDA